MTKPIFRVKPALMGLALGAILWSGSGQGNEPPLMPRVEAILTICSQDVGTRDKTRMAVIETIIKEKVEA